MIIMLSKWNTKIILVLSNIIYNIQFFQFLDEIFHKGLRPQAPQSAHIADCVLH